MPSVRMLPPIAYVAAFLTAVMLAPYETMSCPPIPFVLLILFQQMKKPLLLVAMSSLSVVWPTVPPPGGALALPGPPFFSFLLFERVSQHSAVSAVVRTERLSVQLTLLLVSFPSWMLQ